MGEFGQQLLETVQLLKEIIVDKVLKCIPCGLQNVIDLLFELAYILDHGITKP